MGPRYYIEVEKRKYPASAAAFAVAGGFFFLTPVLAFQAVQAWVGAIFGFGGGFFACVAYGLLQETETVCLPVSYECIKEAKS